ncbi:hypothetical protein [Nocardia nova]|uniref:hypothetical protein n=1 Tax=Nocardia nova TaxID=37330 RepID=UPI0033BFF000
MVEAPPSLSGLRWRTVLFDPHPTLAGKTSGFGEFVELNGEPTHLDAALVPVPIQIPDHIAVFGEPLACAVHCVTRLHRVSAELGLPQRTPVAVIGAGMAGTLISTVLVAQGLPCVLLNHHRERIEFLQERNVLPASVLRPGIPDTRFGRVILATAAATPDYLDTCMNLLADGGVLMVFAGTQPDSRFHGTDVDHIRRHQLTRSLRVAGRQVSIAGTYRATRQDFTAALALLAHPGTTDQRSPAACVQRLTTQTLGLDAAPDYLTAHATHGLFGKTLVQIRPAIHQEPR